MANVITCFRLTLIPVFFLLLVWPHASAEKAAFFVFGIAALSDLVDGYVARKISGVTEFGRLVDPFADRALILAGIIGLFAKGEIPTWALAALLGRDSVMVLGYALGVYLKKPLVKVNQFGRVTNFYLMAAIVLLLFSVAFLKLPIYSWLFYLGVVLYLTSGLVYIVQEISLLTGTVEETAA